MPSYLSSTQTSGPSRRDDLGGVLGRRGEHELERVEQRQLGRRRGASSRARPASRPTSPTSIPAHLTSSSGRSKAFAMAASTQALAQADPQVAAEHLDDVLGGQRVGALEQRAAGSPTCAPGRRPPRSRRTRRPPRGASGSSRAAARGRPCAARRRRRCRGRTSGRRPRRARRAGRAPISVTVVAIADQPSPVGALVGLGERPAGQEDGGDRQLVGRQGRAGSRRARAVFSDVRVVAARRSASSLQRRMAAMVYRARDGAAKRGSRRR